MGVETVTSILIHNPLPEALRHYEEALGNCLEESGIDVARAPYRGIEGPASRAKKTTGWLKHLAAHAFPRQSAVQHLVIWPPTGFLDLALLRALGGPVSLVIHDPTPLRYQAGLHGPLARLGKALAGQRVDVIVHSSAAAEVLAAHGIASRLVAHPLVLEPARTVAPRQEGERRIVRVIGQYKPARRLDVPERVARHLAARRSQVDLEVVGRGWPEVPGWTTDSRWLDEGEFAEKIKTSDLILLPYSEYFQSGVIVRALENSIPVVAQGAWFAALVGPGWPGVVEDEHWEQAVDEVLSAGLALMPEVARRAETAARRDWQRWVDTLGAGGDQ